MILSNPIVSEGFTYDKLIVNLAISTTVDDNANMAMRIVPARVDENGLTVTLDSSAVGIVRGRVSEAQNENEQVFFETVLNAISQIVASKGL